MNIYNLWIFFGMLKSTQCLIRIKNLRLIHVDIRMWMNNLFIEINILIAWKFRLDIWLMISNICFFIFWHNISIHHVIHSKVCIMGYFLCRLLYWVYSKLTSNNLISIPRFYNTRLNIICRSIDYLFYLWFIKLRKSDYVLRPKVNS